MDTGGDGSITLPEFRTFMDDHHTTLPVHLQEWFCENQTDHTVHGPYAANKLMEMGDDGLISKKSLFWTKQQKPMDWRSFKSEEWMYTQKKEVKVEAKPKRALGIGSRANKRFAPIGSKLKKGYLPPVKGASIAQGEGQQGGGGAKKKRHRHRRGIQRNADRMYKLKQADHV
jgi:hypothetical protein